MEELSGKHLALDFYFTDSIHYRPVHRIVDALSRSKRQYRFLMQTHSTITYDELKALKAVGLRIAQFGIESLSTSLLNKMKKGVTAIQNIQALKYARTLDIAAIYNMITYFPSETKKEFNEAIKNIKLCWHLLCGFAESPFALEHGSPVYNDFRRHDIKRIQADSRYRCLFPKPYHEKLKFYFYDFETSHPTRGSYREHLESKGWDGNINPRLEYLDGHDFLVIKDSRYISCNDYYFSGAMRDLYLFCAHIRTMDEIKEHFGNTMQSKDIIATLRAFCRNGLMLREDDQYLSLAIPSV